MPVHPRDAGDQAVGRGVRPQIRRVAAGPLRSHDQAPVLLEAARVAQVVDVLARCAPAGGVPALGGCHPTRIEGGGGAGPQLCQLRPFVLRVGVIGVGVGQGSVASHACGHRRVVRARTHGEEEIPGLHGIAGGHRHRVDPARRGGPHDMLHLHGLEHEEQRARGDGVARRHLDAQDGAGERRRDVGGLGQPGHRGSGTEKPTSAPHALRYETSWAGRRTPTPQVPVG